MDDNIAKIVEETIKHLFGKHDQQSHAGKKTSQFGFSVGKITAKDANKLIDDAIKLVRNANKDFYRTETLSDLYSLRIHLNAGDYFDIDTQKFDTRHRRDFLDSLNSIVSEYLD